MIKLFEAFAGYGSQHMALKKLCDVESVGISEIDSDVIISYASIHHTKQFEELCKKGVKDISKAKEWLKQRNIGFDFLKGKSSIDRMNQDKINKLVAACVVSKNYGDISLVNKKKLNDKIDIFTYSFPCQDISVAGDMNGLSEDSGTRSSLLWQCKEFIELNQPKVLLMENVKNLVGKKFINDYNLWLEELEKLGYKNYWKVLNAKDFGVPQNRERVFCVSIRNDIDLEYSFPQPIILEKRLKDILENKVDEKYYYNNDKARELTKIIVEKYKKKDIIPCDSTINKPKELEVANCITARYDAGIQNQRSIGVAIVEPVIAETRSDEGVRFFKDNVCCTIRTVQSGGDKIVIEPTNKIIQIGNFVETGNRDNPQRGRVYDTDGISPTICVATTVKPNILEKINVLGNIMPSGHSAGRVIDISGVSPTVMENYSSAITIADTNYRIRKLTPKECWRLMGVSDNDFEQAQKYNSNSALYKQAGNSIVVDVLEFIFKNVVDNL